MTEVKVRVEAVRVEGRHRKDLGDIKSLAASIEREGMIHAIALTPDMRLLAGERRLAAVQYLGREFIDARIVDSLDDAAARLRVECDENTERKDMLPSELVALGLSLEALEAPKAAARKAQGRPPGTSRPGTGSSEQGETTKRVADVIGTGEASYRRSREIVRASVDPDRTDEQRQVAQAAVSRMDETGTIKPVYEQWKHRDREQAETKPAPVPEPAAALPPTTEPAAKKVSRRPLPESFKRTVVDLLTAAEKVTRMQRDDRWNEYAPKVDPLTRDNLRRSIEMLTALAAGIEVNTEES